MWGEVTDDLGRRVEKRLRTPNGYAFTVEAALEAVRRVRAGQVAAGAWTPSRAFGADFVLALPDVQLA